MLAIYTPLFWVVPECAQRKNVKFPTLQCQLKKFFYFLECFS